ncbi:hypothetical protein JZ751_027444, partial [Albula glossodonta]
MRKIMEVYSSLLFLWMGFTRVAAGKSNDELDVGFNMRLQQIPSDLPSNITKLNLSHNAIELSEADIQTLKNFSQLTELHLDNNMLTTLPGHMFDNLSHLKILNVSSNNISRVEPLAFAGLANLEELDLSHNSIPSLPPRVFANLSSMKSLYLKGNRLHLLENVTFLDLTHLNHLDLDKNLWNCSSTFLWVMNCLNDKKKLGLGAACTSPKEKAGESIINNSTECFPEYKANPEPPKASTQAPTEASTQASTVTSTQAPTVTSTQAPTVTSTKATIAKSTQAFSITTTVPASSQLTTNTATTGQANSGSTTDSIKDSSQDTHPVGNSWKFLVGVVVTALITSLLIVCTVKSPKWYRWIFDYRHQRLREDESDLFATHCHS